MSGLLARSGVLFLLLSVASSATAQEAAPSTLSAVHLASGGFSGGNAALYRQEIARLTPGSALLADGLLDHDFDSDPYAGEGSGLFEVGVGLRPFRKADRSGPELCLGILYAGRTELTGYFTRITRTPYDTLTSSQTGEVFYIDSVRRSTYAVEYSAERFGLNASLTWRTKGRWSIYGGVGLAGGLLMNARTDVYHSLYDSVDGPAVGPWDGPDGRSVPGGASESFRNGTGWWVSVYAPIGLDFRIARKGELWGRLYLYTELRPQLVFQGLPELGTGTSFGMQNILGLRFAL